METYGTRSIRRSLNNELYDRRWYYSSTKRLLTILSIHSYVADVLHLIADIFQSRWCSIISFLLLFESKLFFSFLYFPQCLVVWRGEICSCDWKCPCCALGTPGREPSWLYSFWPFFLLSFFEYFSFFFFGRIKRRRMNEWRGKKKIIVSEYVMVLALLMHVSIAEMMSCPWG